MSESDSFIEEVSEEVRRDRLFALMRRYGWIAILAILLLVGGAAWHEWRKAQERAEAQALGDAMLTAMEAEDPGTRVTELNEVVPDGPGSAAVIEMMTAAQEMQADPEGAVTRLLKIADDDTGAAPVYRQIATLKAVMIEDGGMDDAARRNRLEGLTLGGGVIRLLAEEQLAYLDIEAGDSEAAMERLRAIRADAGATPGLRRRATQVIVALGGELDPAAGGGVAVEESDEQADDVQGDEASVDGVQVGE